ncbi:MAG: hypothetical protein ACXV2C_00195 [Candidatus Bathyarchaeia archaeon]
MGKESLNISGPLVELEYWLNDHLRSIADNSCLPKHSITNFKYEIVSINDLYFDILVEQKKARQLCSHMSPCGYYGCTEPDKHKLHWIIVE